MAAPNTTEEPEESNTAKAVRYMERKYGCVCEKIIYCILGR